jgi:peroxiredoxin
MKHTALSRRGLLAAGAALPLVHTVGCSGTSTSDGGSKTPDGDVATPSKKGPSAPDFTLPALDGSNIALSDYLGKSVVLLDFWATTCDPCLVEMPHLVAMYEKYKAKGFMVLAISGDDADTRSRVPNVVHEKKMTFPVLMDSETTVIARYHPSKTMPFWVLIDKSGSIVKKKNGYDPGDEVALAREIEKLLQ